MLFRSNIISYPVLILGESGSGKSASMRNMNPDKTLLIQALAKPLPFKALDWRPVDATGGNILVTDKSVEIIGIMAKTKRKIIVVDDWQYTLANEFMRRSDERGYDKFTEIGRHAWDILCMAAALPSDVRVYIMGHTQIDDVSGRVKVKTIGKMLDEKITVEGMFTTVLRTQIKDGHYVFSTKTSGIDPVKSPMGLFDEEFIDNDLNAVDLAICKFLGLPEEK